MCHILPAPATSALRRFLRHVFVKTQYLAAKQWFGTILLGELRLFSHEPARSRPSKEKANEAVVELLAAALGIATDDVIVVSGHSSPAKVVAVSGMDDETIS